MPIRILICDDDFADRKLIRKVLEQSGREKFEIFEAGTKADIDNALRTGNFDLILLDMKMPEKSGLEWLDEIVEKRIAPVVAVTGHSSEVSKHAAMGKGAYGYIPKSWLSTPETALPRINATIECAIRSWRLEEETE